MPAMEPLCRLIGIEPSKLTKEENLLLEVELFSRICEELKEIFREPFREFFLLMKFTTEKENAMLEARFVRLMIHDILSSEDYNIIGIAYYTDTYKDVIEDLLAGRNKSPSAIFLRKLIDLHRSVKPELYKAILKKITLDYLSKTEIN